MWSENGCFLKNCVPEGEKVLLGQITLFVLFNLYTCFFLVFIVLSSTPYHATSWVKLLLQIRKACNSPVATSKVGSLYSEVGKQGVSKTCYFISDRRKWFNVCYYSKWLMYCNDHCWSQLKDSHWKFFVLDWLLYMRHFVLWLYKAERSAALLDLVCTGLFACDPSIPFLSYATFILDWNTLYLLVYVPFPHFWAEVSLNYWK